MVQFCGFRIVGTHRPRSGPGLLSRVTVQDYCHSETGDISRGGSKASNIDSPACFSKETEDLDRLSGDR